jgi:hypothetical protein
VLFDDKLLSALPAPSRQKIEALDNERAARHFTVRTASEALDEARRDHGIALGRAQQAHAENDYGRSLEADAREAGKVEPQRRNDRQAQAVRLMGPVLTHARAVERLQATHDRAVDRWRETDFLPGVHQWLQRIVGSGVRLAHAPLPAAKAKALPDEVERIRSELAGLAVEWGRVESAPSTKDDYRQRAFAEIEALAAKGALEIDMRNRGPNPLSLASHLSATLMAVNIEKETIYRLAGDPGAFLVWLHKDIILARVNSLIDSADDTGAMSHETREKKFAQMNAQRLKLEFEEEAAICAAAASGQSIPRRRNADPRCILEVQEQ